MGKITVADIREALLNYAVGDEIAQQVEKMNDEELLQADFRYDFAMDSMDITELTMELEKITDVSIPDCALEHYDRHGNNFASLLRVYNEEIS